VTHVELLVPHQNDDRELADLAARVRDGSSAAFETLASRVRDRVVGWARGFTGDADEAEDVAQLVLLRLRDHVAEFEGRSQFTSWLYRIARNAALNHGRGDRRRARILEERGYELVEDRVRAEEPTSSDVRQLAEQSLGALTQQQRDLFVACDLEGKRIVDVAEAMGLSAVAARGCLFRARRVVRLQMLAAEPDLLEEYGS
jgi:RNA polymerase sigma-70 factor (ECF subfamily)